MRAVSRPALGRDDLIASLPSLARMGRDGRPRVPFEARAANAAAAGFSGIATTADDYLDIRAAGLSDDDIAAALDAHGLVLGEIDACPLWMGDGPPDDRHLARVNTVLHIAERFGPVHHAVVPVGSSEAVLPPLDVLGPRLHDLAARAANVGMLVAVEFLPWGPLPDAATAWALADAADHPACGINVDFWHHLTGSADESAIRAVPAGRVHCVHLTDGEPDLTESDPLRRTMTQRRLPGAGVFPMVDTIRLLDDIGVTVPYTVEVVSLPHWALTPAEFAVVLHDASRRVLDEARPAPAAFLR